MDTITLLSQEINIPDILTYFIPGYVTIGVFKYLLNSDGNSLSEKIHLQASVCISFFLRLLTSLISGSFYVISLLGTILGVILAVLVYLLRDTKCFDKILAKIGHSSKEDTVLDGCRLFEEGRQVSLFRNDEIIHGRVQLYNQEEFDNYLALDEVIVKNRSGEIIQDLSKKCDYKRCIIALDSIDTMIIHYPKGDRMVPKPSTSKKSKNKHT